MYRKIIFAICVLVQCVVVHQCGVITFHTCRNIKTISNLNLERFQGAWFHVETAFGYSKETSLNSTRLKASCARMDMESTGSGSLSINNSAIVVDKWSSHISYATVSPANSGILVLSKVYSIGGVDAIEMNVLDIDYENHVLLLICLQEDDDEQLIWSGKFSRSRDGYSSVSVQAIDAAVSANAYISNITWRKMDQTVETCGSSASRSRNGYSSVSVKAIDAAVSANASLSNMTWRKTDQTVETSGSSASPSRNGHSSVSVKAIDAAVSANASLSNMTWRKTDQTVESSGSSASVTAASSLLLASLAVVSLVGRT